MVCEPRSFTAAKPSHIYPTEIYKNISLMDLLLWRLTENESKRKRKESCLCGSYHVSALRDSTFTLSTVCRHLWFFCRLLYCPVVQYIVDLFVRRYTSSLCASRHNLKCRKVVPDQSLADRISVMRQKNSRFILMVGHTLRITIVLTNFYDIFLRRKLAMWRITTPSTLLLLGPGLLFI